MSYLVSTLSSDVIAGYTNNRPVLLGNNVLSAQSDGVWRTWGPTGSAVYYTATTLDPVAYKKLRGD